MALLIKRSKSNNVFCQSFEVTFVKILKKTFRKIAFCAGKNLEKNSKNKFQILGLASFSRAPSNYRHACNKYPIMLGHITKQRIVSRVRHDRYLPQCLQYVHCTYHTVHSLIILYVTNRQMPVNARTQWIRMSIGMGEGYKFYIPNSIGGNRLEFSEWNVGGDLMKFWAGPIWFSYTGS